MTQHEQAEQTAEDQRIMRRLALVVGGFMLATGAMAIAIALVVG